MKVEFHVPQFAKDLLRFACVCIATAIFVASLGGFRNALDILKLPALILGFLALIALLNFLYLLAYPACIRFFYSGAFRACREGLSFSGSRRSGRQKVGYTDPFR